MKRKLLFVICLCLSIMTYGQIDFSIQTNGATASFTLTKQGNFYESISWDFGDGNTSQGTNSSVSHTYTTLGNYTVCVIGSPMPMATNDTMCKKITIATNTIKASACESYTLNGKTYDKTGLYTQTLKDILGNDSIISLDLTIISLPPTTEADSLNTSLFLMIPPFYIKAVGTMLKWYSDSKCTNYIGSGSPFDRTNYISNNGKGKYFYVTQTLNSCESNPDSIFVYSVTNCPWKVPIVVGVNKCENDNSLYSTPVIASIPTQTPQPNMVNWEWYSNEGLTTKIASATGSSYLPMNIQSETYYVRYSAIEPSSGMACWSPASKVTRTVNPKPIPQFTNSVKSDYCNYDNFIVLNGIDSKGLTGVNTYNVNGKLINSSVISIENQKSDTSYTVEFVRTSVDGCKDSVQKQIKVHCLTAPTVSSPNPKTIVVDFVANSISEPANLYAMGTGNNEIQWMDATCTTVHSTGNTLITGLTATNLGAMPSKSYTYKVRQKESVSGCVSNCVDEELILSMCPALAPTVVDPYYCVNDPLALTAIAIPQGTQNTGDKLVWYPTSTIGGAPISGFDGVNIYTSSIAKTSPITETVYVAQYNHAYNCYSSVKKVTINVVANPTVNISVPKDVCSADGKVDINVSGNGVLIGDDSGLDASAHTWDPGIVSTATKTINLCYTVTETQADGHTCSTTKSTSITAHFVETPLTEDKTWSIGDIANIPVNFLTANTKGTGVKIKWYADQNKIALLSTTNNYTPDKVAIQAEVTAAGNPKTFTKTYWISQTDATGCESEVVAVNLNLGDCPWQAPVVAGIEKCENDPTLASSALVATIPTQSIQQLDAAKVTWEWWNDASLASKIINATSSTYIPTNYSQTITYYVRYSAIEASSGISCWSPASPVVSTIFPKPYPQISSSVLSDYCYNDKGGVINISGSDTHGLAGTDLFKVTKNGVTTKAAVINIGIPTADMYYDVEYVRTTDKQCKDSVKKTIAIHYVPAPQVVTSAPTILGYGNSIPSATATLTASSIQWYNIDGITPIPAPAGTAATYTYSGPEPTFDVAYPYKVLQIDSYGCKSTMTEAWMVFENCVAKSPIVQCQTICIYDTIPSFTITRTSVNSHKYEFEVYDMSPYIYPSKAKKLATISAGQVFTPVIPNVNAQIYKYWVAEHDIDDNCMGPGTEFSLTVNETKEPVVIVNSPICKNTTNSITLSVNTINGADVYWYDNTANIKEEALNASFINKGNPFFLLGINTFSKGTFTYYASQVVGGCQSAKTAVTFSIVDPTEDSVSVTINKGDSTLIGSIYYKTADTIDIHYNNTVVCDSLVHYFISVKIIGDTNNDGTIDETETAGDIDGDGIINNGEICGDVNGNKVIDATEIAGDINGNGVIDNLETALKTGFRNEIAGDLNGDGEITPPEITGDINGNGTIDSKAETLGDINGNGIIDLNEITDIAILGKTNISVFPSPTKSMIYIKSNKAIKINKVEICSILGNIVQEGNLNTDTKGISIQSLPSGLYIIKIFTEGKIYSQKIIKE